MNFHSLQWDFLLNDFLPTVLILALFVVILKLMAIAIKKKKGDS